MLKLKYYEETGEGTRTVDNYIVIKDYRYAQLIYVQDQEAILYDKENGVIYFCAATINDALERLRNP